MTQVKDRYTGRYLLVQKDVEPQMAAQLGIAEVPRVKDAEYEDVFYRLTSFRNVGQFLWGDVTLIAATEAVTKTSLFRTDIWPEELLDAYYIAKREGKSSEELALLLQPGLIERPV